MILFIKGKNKLQSKQQVANFIIKTERICEKDDKLNNLLSLKIILKKT